jgi:hypothetical protein
MVSIDLHVAQFISRQDKTHFFKVLNISCPRSARSIKKRTQKGIKPPIDSQSKLLHFSTQWLGYRKVVKRIALGLQHFASWEQPSPATLFNGLTALNGSTTFGERGLKRGELPWRAR